MLKGILFDFAPAVAKSLSAQNLLRSLELSGIDYTLCSEYVPPSASPVPKETLFLDMANTLSLSPDTCLILTDSASGIASARVAGVPCIGYAPPGNDEDMSGAYALFEDFASIDVGYLCRTHAHAIGYPADILTTERLMVREFSEEDFPALFAMCTEPSTASYMEETLSDYDTEQEKHVAYIRNVYPFLDLALWGIYEKASGKLIGRAGFSLPENDADTFSLGYLIDVPYRGCGYAKELIPALLSYAKDQGYTEISARIKKDNIASVKVLEQCKYPYECKEDATKGIFTYFIHLIE